MSNHQDYISREAAISALRLVEVEESSYNFPAGMLSELKSIPAADVVEVRHASWMAENSRPKSWIFYCSCCHRTCYDPQPTRAKGWTKRCRYHYCPSCGAKMDGGRDE